ncbi:ML domain-containing protein [Pilobolus umbonatus]|nr:ML domain-containing protein [Pilobolus umbonatus]
MKLLTLCLLLSVFIGIVHASFFPGLVIQEEFGSYIQDSTKLITNCGNSDDLLTIDYVYLNPDPPVKGEDLTIDFKGYLSESVPNGTTVEVVVKYGLVQLIKKKFDFCDKIQEVDEKCPIPEGELTFTKVVALPKEIPPGKYTVHAEIYTPEDKRVACLIGQTIFPRKKRV